MAKNRSPKNENQASAGKSLTVEVPLPVLGVLGETREAFHALCIRTGQQVLRAMMEADREALCGAKGRHQEGRRCWRGGSTASRVTLGGRQVELPRLRVRSPEGEVALASFQWAASTDAMDAHTLAAVAAGVSTRDYPKLLDPIPEAMDERGTSRSALSRRFVALSRKQMGEFLSRPLGELDIAAVFIDAKYFHEHCVLIALGVDSQGNKHVLGLREGSTENTAVTRALLADLVERGLPTERSVLFVIDGAKALRRAIVDVYGDQAVIQRCQVHKMRNVLAHLPEHQHAKVGRCLREAFDSALAARGERRLHNLARSLERDHPGAAASVREGLAETLTVVRLGLTSPPAPRWGWFAADRRAPGADRRLAAYPALDQRHREPQRLGGALHPQRQAMARRGDDSALGQRRSAGCRAAFPTGARLP